MRSPRLHRTSVERRAQSAGFTLVELMVVVLITGILAAIGISLVRGHLNVAKANRALSGIQSIRAAEEAFRAQNGQYLDCSGNNASWYPVVSPGKVKYEWHQPSHPDYARWMGLEITGDKLTQYGYLVNAGNPSTAYPTLQTTTKPVLTPSPDNWYIIQVKGDIDGNGVPMLGLASSFNGEVYLEREGE
jgi:prepilin-type N-terminal cleavage/methylation domain-containing protein